MSNLINLSFETSQQIRIIDQNGEFWFIANDVCNILEIANARDAISNLDDDEKADVALTDISSNGVKQSRKVNIINESGLYTLILRSRKAMQKGTVQHKFRKWVTSEVLPSIRKTGTYTAPVIKPTNTITSQDVSNIKHLVHLCGTPLHASGSARFAIHARLRELTGTTGGQVYTTEHLPLIADELVRIYHVLNQYGTKRRAIEADIIRHVIRGGRDEMLPALLDEMDKLAELRADSFFPTVDKLIAEPVRRLLNRQ